MRIAPLLAARPQKAKAVDVTCAPPDLQPEPGTSAGIFRVAVTGDTATRAEALNRLLTEGTLHADTAPGMFIYRVVHHGSRWVGLVCGVDTSALVSLVGAANSAEVSAAEEELGALGWQYDAAVVQCGLPESIADLYLNDTNERPAYHFVAGGAGSDSGGTHSAWLVHKPQHYVDALAAVAPHAVVRGAARVAAAHRARVPALCVLTRDLPGLTALPPALTPRCGLFVARATLVA